VNKRLLIVDDEDSILFGLKRFFVRMGCTVDCARELEEAEALAAHNAYDLIIADLSLTGNHGTEGLEVIRYARRHCRAVRSIVLTGHATTWIEREAYRRGVNAFLRKPQPLADIAQIAKALIGDAA
jgi:DNA-binding NtrC family response regulator